MSENEKQTVVVFGAGKIGRGFIGPMFSESGYRIVFFDIIPELIDELNKQSTYRVEIIDDANARYDIVTDFSALDSRSSEAVDALASCDIAVTCVGARALAEVAEVIAEGAAERKKRDGGPLDVVFAENQIGVGKIMQDAVNAHLTPELRAWTDENLGLVASVVGRTAPSVPEERRQNEPLLAMIDDIGELNVDRTAFKGPIPDVKGLVPSAPISFYEQRKLYMHNMSHALCAYFGNEHGCEYIWQAIREPDVHDKTEEALRVVAAALAPRYDQPLEDLENYAQSLLQRYTCRALGDTVARVGADPVRKLRRTDRLVGAASLVEEEHLDSAPIVKGIVSALGYAPENDAGAARLQKALQEEEIEQIIEEYMGLKPEETLAQKIAEAWKQKQTHAAEAG